MEPVASPCTQRCALDAAGEACTGCGRCLDEIAAWPRADDATRRAIVARAAERLRTLREADGDDE